MQNPSFSGNSSSTAQQRASPMQPCIPQARRVTWLGFWLYSRSRSQWGPSQNRDALLHAALRPRYNPETPVAESGIWIGHDTGVWGLVGIGDDAGRSGASLGKIVEYCDTWKPICPSWTPVQGEGGGRPPILLQHRVPYVYHIPRLYETKFFVFVPKNIFGPGG